MREKGSGYGGNQVTHDEEQIDFDEEIEGTGTYVSLCFFYQTNIGFGFESEVLNFCSRVIVVLKQFDLDEV